MVGITVPGDVKNPDHGAVICLGGANCRRGWQEPTQSIMANPGVAQYVTDGFWFAAETGSGMHQKQQCAKQVSMVSVPRASRTGLHDLKPRLVKYRLGFQPEVKTSPLECNLPVTLSVESFEHSAAGSV